jgi:hypothetical protein
MLKADLLAIRFKADEAIRFAGLCQVSDFKVPKAAF